MHRSVTIVGAGLAGSEAALVLAGLGTSVRLVEMRPVTSTAVHATSCCAELVCSNSLKSTRPTSAAGMLKHELDELGSPVFSVARRCAVPAGGALAVDRERFSTEVTALVERHPLIELERREVLSLATAAQDADAVLLATGPLTSDALAEDLARVTGRSHLAFFDAAAPIVMADSLDPSRLFRQNRYEGGEAGEGDYLNAPMSRPEYDAFVDALVGAERVVARDFETHELFQACQPIEEIARKGHDAPRFGTLKPVGLVDPRTGRRPWAALQLRAENARGSCYNLVGFQTNLTFPEQRRVFRLVPGLEQAEFARYGVMHRNTFLDAPSLLDGGLRLRCPGAAQVGVPVFVAGQLAGTEGYCEAIRSGMHAAVSIEALLEGVEAPPVPSETAFGALMAYATSPETVGYQPMHVNFGIMPPLETRIRNKQDRYAAFADRGARALARYASELSDRGLLAASRA